MFTHQQIWAGIDRLAKEKGWSPSRLAREAGLDPTTFNPSKRHTNQEKPRWPSTESLAKILEATSTSLETFVGLMFDVSAEGGGLGSRSLRSIRYHEASQEGLFDGSGFPIGDGWDEIDFPGFADKHTFALEVQGDRLRPAYRDGDVLIVSPNASVRRHDHVVLKASSGALSVGVLLRRTAQRIELEASEGNEDALIMMSHEFDWVSRVIWVKFGS